MIQWQIMSEFRAWLEGELKNRGWSQRELARQSGVKQSRLSDVIRGVRNPGPKFCGDIARAFGIPVEVVMRAAAILPPSAELEGLSEEAQAAAFLVEQLPEGKRAEALRYLRFLLRGQD